MVPYMSAYKSDVSSSYPSNIPNDSIFDHLIHNWMEEREIAIETATAKLKQEIENGKYEVQRNVLESSNSPQLLPHELEKIKHFLTCHSLFWPTESKSEATGICPFTASNRQWLENNGMSDLFPMSDCTEGYDLNTVDLISHLQSHHSHWMSKIASLILMEHDVLSGMHLPSSPASAIKESRSPHQPQKLFKNDKESTLDSTGNNNDDLEEGTFSKMRHSKLLSGILESSSEEENDQHSSDSDTASESKRYAKFKAARFKDAKTETWTRTRLRERKNLLKMVDDGESSVTSVLTNQDT
jgi:hypothetical protein